jgi:hypothetical protein
MADVIQLPGAPLEPVRNKRERGSYGRKVVSILAPKRAAQRHRACEAAAMRQRRAEVHAVLREMLAMSVDGIAGFEAFAFIVNIPGEAAPRCGIVGSFRNEPGLLMLAMDTLASTVADSACDETGGSQ